MIHTIDQSESDDEKADNIWVDVLRQHITVSLSVKISFSLTVNALNFMTKMHINKLLKVQKPGRNDPEGNVWEVFAQF